MSDSPAKELADRILELIMAPTARDQQVQIGPSNIGDPCDKCLGLAMAGILPDGPRARSRGFNMMAWQGSAPHHQLEYQVQQAILTGDPKWWGVRTERKVSIGEVKGYGEVSGSIDLSQYDPPVVLDYKVRSLKYIKRYKPIGFPPIDSRTQVHTYGLGMELAGNPPKEVGLMFFPRDSMDPRDIWVHVEPYQRKIALAAKKRAARVFKDYVLTGRTALLLSHSECYNCSSFGSPKVRFEETDN